MSNASIRSRYFASCAVLAGAGVFAACGPLGPAIAEQEVFDFYFQRLQPDANGQYALKMNLGSGCRDYLFSEAALADALRTKQFQITQPPVRTASLTFEAITECQTPPQEVKFESAQLSQPFTDPNGNPARRRPHSGLGADVVAELSTGGVMQVAVMGIKVNGTTTSRTNTPGPIDLTSAEAPAAQVGASSGLYSHANVNPLYAEARLTNVLASPNRFTAEFSFLAKTDPASPELLLVWDGDLVLRTDIED